MVWQVFMLTSGYQAKFEVNKLPNKSQMEHYQNPITIKPDCIGFVTRVGRIRKTTYIKLFNNYI